MTWEEEIHSTPEKRINQKVKERRLKVNKRKRGYIVKLNIIH